MEYTIREIIQKTEHFLPETDYAHSSDDMLDFRLFSGDFYQWEAEKLRFKECVEVMDFEQTAKTFPAFENIRYKSREKFPYFTGNLEMLAERWKHGETIAVEGGPCLFGAHEVSVIVRLNNDTVRMFDYANGKAYKRNYSDSDFSETDTLAEYLRQYGQQTEQITFRQEKMGLTPQEYLNLRYPFEIASALGGPLVIPIPDMSYRKFLLAVLEFVPEHLRKQALNDFDAISADIVSFYLTAIENLQKEFQIENFLCVHGGSQEELQLWYEKRLPYLERGKILRSLTRLPEKINPIKDYISMPALPFYLFDAPLILQVDSMDETDSYRKCKKAHKKAFQMGCIMIPELLSGDDVHTFYEAPLKWKAYGNYSELTSNYRKGD